MKSYLTYFKVSDASLIAILILKIINIVLSISLLEHLLLYLYLQDNQNFYNMRYTMLSEKQKMKSLEKAKQSFQQINQKKTTLIMITRWII